MSRPETHVVTLDEIRVAMERMRDAPRGYLDSCPPHLVHPDFASMEVSDVPTADIAMCANLCGWAAYMRPRSPRRNPA